MVSRGTKYECESHSSTTDPLPANDVLSILYHEPDKVNDCNWPPLLVLNKDSVADLIGVANARLCNDGTSRDQYGCNAVSWSSNGPLNACLNLAGFDSRTIMTPDARHDANAACVRPRDLYRMNTPRAPVMMG